jgi:hypothetical protein
VRRASLLIALALFFAGCADDEGDLVARSIVSTIPWPDSETARYRLTQGDELKGSGELELLEDADETKMTQTFAFPEQGITDAVEALVESATIRPQSVQRVIDGPEGKRECDATYDSSSNSVTVQQRAGEDERTDDLSVPPEHYDSWTDLFLWRTIDFFEGNELEYVDVLSCSLAKPDLLSVVLEVKEIEEVTVPAGTFQAWRMEIRSGGRTQKAWYADTETRMLVRYDNGDLVFELESIR